MLIPHVALLLLSATFTLPASRGSIEWQPSADAAFELARKEARPVFIAVNMDNEWANDEAVEVHYRNAGITRLARQTANLFVSRFDHGSGERPCPRVGSITCAQPRPRCPAQGGPTASRSHATPADCPGSGPVSGHRHSQPRPVLSLPPCLPGTYLAHRAAKAGELPA